eukprot:10998806-Ditylum_brightwellii.AAC.1
MGAYLVFLNGLLLGAHARPRQFVQCLRTIQQQGQAGEFLSVYLHKGQQAVHIAMDGGRVCHPLIIVDEKRVLPRLKQVHVEGLAIGAIDNKNLLHHRVVEYIDVNKENNCLIAVTEHNENIDEGLV